MVGNSGVAAASKGGQSELEGWIAFLSDPQAYAKKLQELRDAEASAKAALASLARGRNIEKLHQEAADLKSQAVVELEAARAQIADKRAALAADIDAKTRGVEDMRRRFLAERQDAEAQLKQRNKSIAEMEAKTSRLLEEAERAHRDGQALLEQGMALRDEWVARKKRMEDAWNT